MDNLRGHQQEVIDAMLIRTEIARTLKEEGFRSGAASTWVFKAPMVSVGVGLQRHRFTQSLLIDACFWLRPGELAKASPVHESDMYLRMENLFPDLLDVIRQGLYFGTERERSTEPATVAELARLTESLRTVVIPQLKIWTDLHTLARDFKAGRFRNGLVTVEARRLLESVHVV